MKEPLDHLINDLGFLKASKHSVKEIKSPMPGLVVNIFVEEGQSVAEGEKLLSLEAMKMENILKSPGDGIIKSVKVSKGNSVDKNQILVVFE
jgi:biotin carboxyl carrier protein